MANTSSDLSYPNDAIGTASFTTLNNAPPLHRDLSAEPHRMVQEFPQALKAVAGKRSVEEVAAMSSKGILTLGTPNVDSAAASHSSGDTRQDTRAPSMEALGTADDGKVEQTERVLAGVDRMAPSRKRRRQPDFDESEQDTGWKKRSVGGDEDHPEPREASTKD
ncbi:hypothetical protein LTR36_001814 [Oleoguttula mirabilis]|uniref:Uncharacterized protein n=1 Tax=Oleoguttula mirabilis TaxID=1507867 RepID=A0AAV9JML9_9PEZI|nr:hypothetical protein LTR36_001814 [Oleoguttula mirabilis]